MGDIPSAPGVHHSAEPSFAGKVLNGTCGWSDFTIPGSSKHHPDRLLHYARVFPCVEVDTSSYAIPKADHVAKWVKSTTGVYPDFKFHFKAFGLFCHQSAPVNSFPWKAKEVLRAAGMLPYKRNTISLADLPPGCEQACWDAFHASIEPAVKAGALASVVFQYQLNFGPSNKHRQYVERCRRMLRQDVVMAVEFRSRAWFQDPEALQELHQWCVGLGLVLIAADELRHETFQNNRAQTGLPTGQVREVLPIAMSVTRPDMLVVRLHRRHGCEERLLTQEEHKAWSDRLASVAPSLHGPIYFLWGTDWQAAPVVNARSLTAALPPALQFDYRPRAAPTAGTITALFQSRPGGQRASRPEAGAADNGDVAGIGDGSTVQLVRGEASTHIGQQSSAQGALLPAQSDGTSTPRPGCEEHEEVGDGQAALQGTHGKDGCDSGRAEEQGIGGRGGVAALSSQQNKTAHKRPVSGGGEAGDGGACPVKAVKMSQDSSAGSTGGRREGRAAQGQDKDMHGSARTPSHARGRVQQGHAQTPDIRSFFQPKGG